MAEYQDLEILGTVVAGANKEAGEQSKDQAEEEQHRAHSRVVSVANLGF